jgi:nucleoside-diphosphate-sugar epimerase/2-polyprenyl-3-methyl-5-hydroxy-6-metoxy-1,4-benzoquinol methylase|tara:strand:- start:7730 stop:9883 length:2154 start_codon:yes stop_codon:yes gene_type:complete
MKKILILGGCGYIGSMVVKKLRTKYKITIIDLNTYKHNIFKDIEIIKKNMKYINKEFIEKFDIIISLSGNSSVKCSSNIFSSIENNIENLTNIFKIMNKDQMFIYASSSSVYGDTTNLVVDEKNENYNFHNYYDFSKKILDMYAELIIKKENKKIFGLRFGTVNGFSPNFRNDIMINAMTNIALLEKEVKIFSKETRRPILGLSDLCNAISRIIELGNNENSGMYNLASFNSTVEIIGTKVAKIVGVKCINCDELTKNITNVKLQTSSYNFSINCEKFKNNFNFKFEDTVDSIVKDIQNNYDKIIINKNRNNDIYLDYVFPCKKLNKCRVCDNENIISIFNLKKQPLANSLHNNLTNCEMYPLNLMVCQNCFHLQLEHVISPNILYKNYIYESGTSDTLLNYFNNLFIKINNLIQKTGKKTIIEVACNDGSQLDFFKKGGWNTVGIDPAENLAEISGINHDIYCDFLNENITTIINEKYKNIDVILCQNVFAHTNNINEFISACKICMNDNTRLFIQVSQANLVRDNQYDTVYHEHLSFFNINSMKYIVEKFGLFINNIEKPPIHGTSYLFEICKIKNEESNLLEMLEEENSIGLTNINTYYKYAETCKEKSMKFKINILKYILEGYTIIGYGASAKGNTILNYMKITNNEVKYIVDDQKTKQGLYTPGSNILICDKSKLLEFDKVAVLMITWNFKDEIIKKVNEVRGEKETKYIFY